MSGHSKWSQIKHKKALSDAQKSAHFTKLARQIVLAAKKGQNPASNPDLRQAIEKARKFNMPSENIERAVKKGAGKEKEALEEVLFETYGPGGSAILISGITDNKNRTSQEIKHILSEHGVKLASPGAAKFLFQKVGDGWQAKNPIAVDEKTKSDLIKLFEILDENDDVQDIFTNADIAT